MMNRVAIDTEGTCEEACTRSPERLPCSRRCSFSSRSQSSVPIRSRLTQPDGSLFQSNKVIGLINLDVLLVADNLLLIPIFLALYVALRRSSESLVTLGTTAGLLAIPLFISSIPAFEMLSLSDRVRPSQRQMRSAPPS